MIEREKVIAALECCLSPNDHENCPYDGIGKTYSHCLKKLVTDALALLKEQEAVEPKIFRSEDFLWSQWYICGACEYPVDPGDKFCRKCGRPIKWEEDSDSDEN